MNILVTGAASGIGFKTAIELAKRGHFVYLTTHTKEQCNHVLKKCSYSNIKCFKLDVTNEFDRKLVDKLDIDVLINHAGIGIGGSIVDMDIDKVRENYEVNIFGNFSLLQRVYNNMLKNHKQGKILVTSSLAGIIPIPFLGSYCSTKSAISMLINTLRIELKLFKSDIQVALIEPGAYHTGFNQVMINNKDIKKDSLFYNKKMQITLAQYRLFHIIEKKSIKSIVKKIIKAVESNKLKAKYRAPFSQKLMAKLYLIFLK